MWQPAMQLLEGATHVSARGEAPSVCSVLPPLVYVVRHLRVQDKSVCNIKVQNVHGAMSCCVHVMNNCRGLLTSAAVWPRA